MSNAISFLILSVKISRMVLLAYSQSFPELDEDESSLLNLLVISTFLRYYEVIEAILDSKLLNL
jgi:hypothetical protein